MSKSTFTQFTEKAAKQATKRRRAEKRRTRIRKGLKGTLGLSIVAGVGSFFYAREKTPNT